MSRQSNGSLLARAVFSRISIGEIQNETTYVSQNDSFLARGISTSHRNEMLLIELQENGTDCARGFKASSYRWVDGIIDESKLIPCENPWKEFMRLGQWEFRYENGQKKATISFNIGKYLSCVIAGPGESIYEYKFGAFSYWYPNGEIMASGIFEPKRIHVRTSCEGGDEVEVAYIPDAIKFYDEAGNEIQDLANRNVLRSIILDL